MSFKLTILRVWKAVILICFKAINDSERNKKTNEDNEKGEERSTKRFHEPNFKVFPNDICWSISSINSSQLEPLSKQILSTEEVTVSTFQYPFRLSHISRIFKHYKRIHMLKILIVSLLRVPFLQLKIILLRPFFKLY